jgi:hypothetical protein
MIDSDNFGYVEIKGSSKRLNLYDVKEIFSVGTVDALVTCATLTDGAKKYINNLGAFYAENVSLEDVMNYDILQERL